jgi:Kef-type K+ transport system membrane component KefB
MTCPYAVGMFPAAATLTPTRAVLEPPLDAGSAETLGIIAGLFVLILAAKLGEEAFRRIGLPGVVGELAGGFLVGPYALALVKPGETATVLSDIGVVILLFAVGLEIKTDELLQVGRPAAITAVLGLILPILAGTAYALLTGEAPSTAAFVGLALAATSIGITSRVLSDLGVMDRRFSRITIGAAVIDDVLALILIGIVSGAADGDLSIATLGLVVGALGLAAIIGAFVAGLIVAETDAREELEHEIKPLASIFTPFFFAVTGAQLDLGALLDPFLALAAIVLAVIGVATKVLGGMIGARSSGRWSSITVGVGMAPRGEVGIVVVGLGLTLGLLTPQLFSVVLIAIVLTTVAAPILLNLTIPRALEEGRQTPARPADLEA